MRVLTAFCKQCGTNRDMTVELDGTETTSSDRANLPVPEGASPLAYPRWLTGALLRCPDGHLVLRIGIAPDELPVPSTLHFHAEAKA